jgi:hypothetical protein
LYLTDAPECHSSASSRRTLRPGTVDGVKRLERMTIDALTGVVAVSLVVALICHLWPPPDDNGGPGGNGP